MTDGLQQTADNLIQSLEEAIFVFEEQNRRAESARLHATATQERFMQFLDARRTARETSDVEERRRQMQDMLSSNRLQEDGGEFARLGVRWEQAFCNIYEALMRLYAYPKAQSRAEEIAGIIRTLRLLQIEDASYDTPEIVPPPAHLPEGAELEPASDKKARMADYAFQFMSRMNDHVEQVQQGFQEKTARTEQLLQEALEKARNLAHT